MERIAFQIGALTIYWYGIFVSLGFMAAYLFMQWRAGKTGFPKDRVSDLCFAAMVGGVIGARIFYVALNFDQYSHELWEIIRIDHGGLVFYGGFIGAVATILWLIRKNKLDLSETADLLSLALPLGQAIGRIGCFINGCCFGKPSQLWCSVRYPLDSGVWSTQVHQHLISPNSNEPLPVLPVQLFQSGTNIVIWLSLLLLSSKAKFKGQIFPLYLIFYSVGRFFIEFNRGDYLVRYWGFTISQLVCILILPIGLILFLKLRKAHSQKIKQ